MKLEELLANLGSEYDDSDEDSCYEEKGVGSAKRKTSTGKRIRREILPLHYPDSLILYHTRADYHKYTDFHYRVFCVLIL